MSRAPFKAVVDAMEDIAPLAYADHSWDNVGVLVENPQPKETKTVLLTIDLTEAVLDEAVAAGASVIVAYHPPIFRPFKSLTLKDHKAMLVMKALVNGISIYSPHSALDSTKGGVNDWLCSGLPAVRGIECITKLKGMEERFPEEGQGKVATVDATISELVESVKKHLNIDKVRLALGAGHEMATKVKAVAICAGSGASLVRLAKGADVYLTGEMSHHEVLAANAAGVTCILSEHTLTERGYLSARLKPALESRLDDYTVTVSTTDANPINIC